MEKSNVYVIWKTDMELTTILIEYISSQDDFSSVSDKKNCLGKLCKKKWDFGSNGRGEIINVTLWNWEVVSNNYILKLK